MLPDTFPLFWRSGQKKCTTGLLRSTRSQKHMLRVQKLFRLSIVEVGGRSLCLSTVALVELDLPAKISMITHNECVYYPKKI